MYNLTEKRTSNCWYWILIFLLYTRVIVKCNQREGTARDGGGGKKTRLNLKETSLKRTRNHSILSLKEIYSTLHGLTYSAPATAYFLSLLTNETRQIPTYCYLSRRVGRGVRWVRTHPPSPHGPKRSAWKDPKMNLRKKKNAKDESFLCQRTQLFTV